MPARLLRRLHQVWWTAALALLAVAATAVAMHLIQAASQDRVLETRSVLRASRTALALTIDRMSTVVSLRLGADDPGLGDREREVRAALLAQVDSLVLLTGRQAEQQQRALALQLAVRRWTGDTIFAPAVEPEARAALVEEVSPNFTAIRGALGRFIAAEEDLYAESVRRSTQISSGGLAVLLLQLALLALALRWFRDRAVRQADEITTQQARLREQAVELEKQVEASRALSRELAQSNRELAGREQQQREAREAIEAADRRHRALIDQTQELFTIVNTTAQFEYASSSLKQMLGWTPEELRGESVLDFVHPDDRALVEDKFRHVLEPGATATVEYRCRKRDGSWRRFSSIATNLLHDPAIGGIVVNSRDVTEHRQLQEQLSQAQKMEAIGRLAGGVAHDFNNLLTSIKLNCQLLEQMLGSGRPELTEVREIGLATERATGLTQQLLAFSRKQVLQPRVLDMNATVREMERMLSRLLGEDVEIITHLDPNIEPVLADPGQLQQVVMNLAVNAGDAMPHGGRLMLSTSMAESIPGTAAVEENGDNEYVMLAVTDTGVGMDEMVRSRIFEPFFTTKPPGKGTGLGLPMVYGIMQQSGGHVWVYSEPGQGTTFKLYFRAVRDGTVSRPAENREEERPGGTETVLVVEDESTVRALILRVLREAGYQVLEAANGREALEICTDAQRGVQLVVTDVIMPEMSGRQFAEQMVARDHHAKLLFISGYTDDEILRRGMLDPGVAFLQKPFGAGALLRVVRRVLDGRHTGEHELPFA